jgi:hypothetical protein
MKNSRKAAIGAAIVLACALLSFGSSSAMRAAAPARLAAPDHQAGKQRNSRRTPATITLTVHVLHTTYGIPSQAAYTYPKSTSLRNAGEFADQIAAFGGANHVWIGPKGWTGSAGVGADGGTGVDLHPVGGSSLSGPHIQFEATPACVSCMLGGAALYFPGAKQEYDKSFPAPLPPPPHGLRISRLSPTLVRYSLPDESGLMVRGIVYFKGPYDFLESARFVLPHADAKLLNFLMQTFIRREKLK